MSECVKYRAISGVQPSSKDVKIKAVLSKINDGGGNTMDIAVLNDNGEAYLHVMPTGLGAYISTCQAIKRIGFHDCSRNELPANCSKSYDDVLCMDKELPYAEI